MADTAIRVTQAAPVLIAAAHPIAGARLACRARPVAIPTAGGEAVSVVCTRLADRAWRTVWAATVNAGFAPVLDAVTASRCGGWAGLWLLVLALLALALGGGLAIPPEAETLGSKDGGGEEAQDTSSAMRLSQGARDAVESAGLHC